MVNILKKIGIFILIVIAILAIGIVGRADYEYEMIELQYAPKTRMPYYYEN